MTIVVPIDGASELEDDPLLEESDESPQAVRTRTRARTTLTTRGADIALRALHLGAADYVPKPSAVHGDETFHLELLAKVKGLARLRHRGLAPSRETAGLRLRPAPSRSPLLLAVGSSTGGPQALFTETGCGRR